MPIHAPSDTLRVLGEDARDCESRSLFQDRFAQPQAKEDERKQWFRDLLAKRAAETPASSWLPGAAERVHARLRSRLAIDLSGGVMENAHVRLDRYGLPSIPGSATKGCARRMALQALHDWVAAGTERPAEDDACAPCCEGFAAPDDLLAAIASTFGWVEQDWEAGKREGLFRSDFGWACGEEHETIWTAACQRLAERHGWTLPERRPWKEMPAFAGTIAFLPASPNRNPGLELDVVTPHHRAYYEGTLDVATDTEDPVPVNFPAVRPQSESEYFTFPLLPLRRAREDDLRNARLWLENGLDLFGLGAKTNAGYGWFAPCEPPQETGDYANETVFTNAVLDRLNKPQEYDALRKEIEKLQVNPANAAWIEVLRENVRKNKSAKKRLKQKDWFPNEWLSASTNDEHTS